MRRQDRIPFDRHALAVLPGAFVFVAVIAIVGPGRVFHWFVSFLVPMAIILLVVVGMIGLLAREGGRSWIAETTLPRRTRGHPLGARASLIQCTGC